MDTFKSTRKFLKTCVFNYLCFDFTNFLFRTLQIKHLHIIKIEHFIFEKGSRIPFNPPSVILVALLGTKNWYQSKHLKNKYFKDHNKQQDEQEGCRSQDSFSGQR